MSGAQVIDGLQLSGFQRELALHTRSSTVQHSGVECSMLALKLCTPVSAPGPKCTENSCMIDALGVKYSTAQYSMIQWCWGNCPTP